MAAIYHIECTYQSLDRVPYKVDEGEEYDDDGCDGSLRDGMVHVGDDAGDGLPEAGGAQGVPDRLRRGRRRLPAFTNLI